MRLTIPNRSNVLRARRLMGVTVTASPGAMVSSSFEELAAVVVRAGHLLAVNLGAAGAAKLLKLAVERLAVGADMT
jgi:hypothetical protein